MEYRTKFISLDLETTHLDPREGKIIEVAAQEVEFFFDPKKQVANLRWGAAFESLVNPEREVPAAVLRLTGIRSEDLNKALLWRDVSPKLKKFLGDEPLLGHNLGFDLAFLREQGLPLKNRFVDTLEFGQTLIPLAGSHSLQFLSESFNIDKTSSHRALADARTAARVLVAMLNVFAAYTEELQDEIMGLLKNSKISFQDLVLGLPLRGKDARTVSGNKKKANLKKKTSSASIVPDWPDENTITSLPFDFAAAKDRIAALAILDKPGIIGVSHQMYLEAIPSDQLLFGPKLALCTIRRKRLEAESRVPDAVIKILIKTAILLATQPPGLDLSLVRWTFEEKDFLHLLTVDPGVCESHNCQYAALLDLQLKRPYFLPLAGLFELTAGFEKTRWKDRSLILQDLAVVEDRFAESQTTTLNLVFARRVIDVMYPLRWGRVLSDVKEIENELDLFFGILHLVYLKREGDFSESMIIDGAEFENEKFKKFFYPAQKLKDKLHKFYEFVKQKELLADLRERIELSNLKKKLMEMINFIEEFFIFPRRDERIYWLSFGASAVDLNSSPRTLRFFWQAFAKRFEEVSFFDYELPASSMEYFQSRLGLENFVIKKAESPGSPPPAAINIYSSLGPDQRLDLLRSLSGRSIVVLPNERQLSDVFIRLGAEQSGDEEILAHKFSGNPYSLREKTRSWGKTPKEPGRRILLLSTYALLRHWQALPPANNLVIWKLPFEPPVIKPVLLGDETRNEFLTRALPRAIHNLHVMLTRFLGAGGGERKAVFLLDGRVSADYDQAFLKYLNDLPGADISTDQGI